jgi:phospholipid/cholesterol/gamma-HCH transport system substrate-binding protein
MPFSTTARVGIITLIGLLTIALMIIWKSEVFLIGKGYDLVASFENVEGLTIGSEVRFRGLKVGKVMRIDPGPYDIKIYSVIEPHIKISSDSTLRVAYDGIVGLKFLEIRPGTSKTLYRSNFELKGTRTSAIVDFVDIGSQNLVETKAILETIRKFVENPALQKSLTSAIFTAEKTAEEAEQLTKEMRLASQGLAKITADPKFQENVKGTISETEKTLSSANRFFEGVAKINLRTSGGVDLGSRANAVRGDIDIIQGENNYYRFGIGEGPTRQMSLLDFIFTNRMSKNFGFRLGVVNSQLGGGIVFKSNDKRNIIADIYDLNNYDSVKQQRLWPKLRLGYQHEMQEYMDLLLQTDDLLNGGSSNIMFGLRVKSPGEKLY